MPESGEDNGGDDREELLERRDDRLLGFATFVAHDLRTPLQKAVGYNELAREECDSDYLAELASALDELEATIDETVSLAKSGETVLDRSPVDLAPVVSESWDEVELDGLTLDVESSATVTVDRERLKQVFKNVFRNTHSHNDGGVTVTVGMIDSMAVSTRGSSTGRYDGFYIEDDGAGVPVDRPGEVFESEYTTGGSGWGLMMVKDIVEAHGWRVRMTESDDGGTRIEVRGAGEDIQ